MSKAKPEAKVTLAPSSEQATVLPDFPMLWTPLGVYVETAEENLDHQIIVQLVNKFTSPWLNVVTINIEDLIEQEIRATTDLGLRLKAAKKDTNEKKKKETDQQKWMPPSALLLELINARMSSDQDLEHKKEAAKRKKNMEDARVAVEAGNTELKAARDELVSTEGSMKVFKSGSTKVKEEEKLKESNTSKKGILVPLSAKHEKEKMELAISGNLKVTKDKISKSEMIEGEEDDTWQKLLALYNQAKVKCQEMERKFMAKMSRAKYMEATLLEPYNLAQAYILLGLVSDPSFIASLAGGEHKILYAILILKTKNNQAVKIINQNIFSKDESNSCTDSFKTSLAVGLETLAKASNIDHPARQIAIIAVEYENLSTIDSKDMQDLKDTDVGEKKSAKVKAKDVDKALPYENISKALALSLLSLVQKLIAYSGISNNIHITKVPDAVAFKDVDTRYYNQLLSEVPTNFLKVPILLHCLLEQAVLNSSCTAGSKQTQSEDGKKRVQEYMVQKFVKLGEKLPSSLPYNPLDSQLLHGIQATNCPLNGFVNATQGFLSKKESDHKALRESLNIVHDFDELGKDIAFFSEGQSTEPQQKTLKHVAEVSKRLAKLMSVPGKHRQGMPNVALLSREERGTLESKIRDDGQYCLSLVQTIRKLRKFKEFLLMSRCNNTLEVLQLKESLHSINSCQYMELFPDTSISEVYSKAKIICPFERLFYDEMEDCLVAVLYATSGEFEQTLSIPCQITFGDFCIKHQDLRSFTTAPRSYKLEEHRGQVNDKKYYHLLEGGGLFSCGLPSMIGNVREPQGTLYMDGNTFIMRSVKRESRRDIELSVCFEDGLIACFFMENGSISLQLSNPNGTTIQMDTSGSTYMCSTYMDFQSQMNCQHSEKRNPKQTDSRNGKSTFGDLTNNFGRKEVERDCWRCILPSGTVLCNQKNGELAAMFRNGNVSEYKVVNSQCCQWTTTNSQGYQVVQVLQEKSIEQSHGDQNQTLVDQAEISPKLKAEKDQKMSPKTSKETKQIKKDEVAEVVPLKIVSMKKNEVIADAKERMGQEHESKTPSDVVGKNLNPLGQDLPKIVSNDPFKPCLFLLPKKRVVSIMDVETKCHIKSREDLVTLVWTPEGELIAQHSDGTQMYTRLSKSQSTLDNTVTTCKNNCVSSATQNNGLATVQSSSVLQRNTMETAKLLSMESSASSASARTCKPSISTHLHDLMVSSGNVDWQIMKENYPIIWSEGDNIVVDISTHQNKYILSFCRSTGSLHLLLPGGQCMYTSGLSVFLDYSNLGKSIPQSDNPVEEVKDLETWEHSHVGSKKVNQDQGQQGQHNRTNGLYKFNLEEGAISHEDSFGDGFYASQDGDVQRLCGDRAKEAQVAEATNSEMLDKLKAPKLPTSLGPSPRLFVLHEDGHGYELFGPDAFDRELEKIQKEVHSFHISEAYNCTPTQGSLHTFIRRLCTNSEDFRPSLSCYGKRALESTCQAWPSKKGSLEDKPKHCAHLKRALPMLYSLPQVLLQTPSCKPVSKHNEFVISYRHVREYPTMDDTQIMEMDQYIAKLREWTVDALMSSSMAAADENLQQGEDVTGAKSEIPQVFATTPRLSGVSENTTLDGNKEKIRIAHLIMADLQAHIQQFKAKLKEDESVREEASSRALNKLSRCVAKNLLEEIMTSCSRRMCNKQDLFFYFSCEEGLQAWLKEQGRQNWDEVAQVFEETVQGIVNVMPNGS